MTERSHRFLLVAGGVGLVLAVVLLLVLVLGPGSARESGVEAVPGSASPALRERFEILLRGVRPEDQIPGSPLIARDLRVRAEDARLAYESQGHPVWVAPSADGACLIDLPSDALGPGFACFDDATILKGDAYVVIGDSGAGKKLLALVPDDATDPVVRGAPGRSARISGNVLVAGPQKAISGYRYRTRDEVVRVSVGPR